MITSNELGSPENLSAARFVAHGAAQLLYRAAVANIAPQPGDEHSNLGWDSDTQSFSTHPLNGTGTIASLRLSPLTLSLGGANCVLDSKTVPDALAWLDAELTLAGLKPASGIKVTYDLPEQVSALGRFSDDGNLTYLAAWFDLAARSLSDLAGTLTSVLPGPSAVRCWPHHFDIATYVSLEQGDPEKARGIGVGLSPGDGSYDQPYFYVNAWPHLEPRRLPAAVPPGHWHTDGFVGSIATGSEVIDQLDIESSVRSFLKNSFETNRTALGC